MTTLAFRIVWAVKCTFLLVNNVKLTRLVRARRTGWGPMYKRHHSLHSECSCKPHRGFQNTVKSKLYGPNKMPAPNSLRKRWQIVGMSRGSLRPGAIATQIHVSRKSVWSILSLHKRTHDVTPGKSSGSHRMTSARQNRLHLGMVRRGRRRLVASLRDEWRNDLERPVSKVTVNRRLLERGYRMRRLVKKPKLTVCHKGLCLHFAKQHRNLTVHHWRHVVFWRRVSFPAPSRWWPS